MARAEDERAIYEAIREKGAAEALIYADWLQQLARQPDSTDPDHARAEFTRMQVQLERGTDLSGNLLPPNRAASLRRDAAKLCNLHWREWELPLMELGAHQIGYRLGAAWSVTMKAEDFLANGDLLFEEAPTVASVRLTGSLTPEQAGALAASPLLAHLTRLTLDGNRIEAAAVQALADSPHLRNLTHLNIVDNHVGERGARALAGSHLPKLTHLGLIKTGIGTAGLRALAASPLLAHLTSLDLKDSIFDEGAQVLAGSRNLRNLTRLGVGRNQLTARGAAALAGSAHLGNLTWLGLELNQIGAEGATVLADAERLGKLTHLDLTGNGIGDAGAAALAGSAHLGNLTHLGIASNRIGEEGARALVGGAGNFPKLTSLHVAGNGLPAMHMAALMPSPLRGAILNAGPISSSVRPVRASWAHETDRPGQGRGR